jgi:hypothetical protein
MTSIAEQLRRQGWKPDQIATALVDGRPIAEVERSANGWPGYRSKWEALYAVELDDQKASGEIAEWSYETMTLQLTEATIVNGKRKRGIYYTADFVVWTLAGRLRLIEVKGYRRNAGINRYKQAKDKFRHIEFLMVTREHGYWETIF